MLIKIIKRTTSFSLIILIAVIAMSCQQHSKIYGNTEIELSESHCIAIFDKLPYFSVSFDADIEVPNLPEYYAADVKAKSLSAEGLEYLIHTCVGGDDSIQLFKQWELSKDELMVKLEKAKQYAGTEKVTDDYVKWLEESINNAAETPARIPLKLNDVPIGIPVLAYAKNSSNNSIALIYFVRDGDFLFLYQRDKFTEVVPESMTAEHQFDPNYETEAHFRRKKPETPAISQNEAYAVAIQCLDVIASDLKLYSSEPCSILKDSAIDKETGWMFVFTREAFGLQGRYEEGWTFVNPDYQPSHVAAWAPEIVKIAVDSTGICSLLWQGASRIISDTAQTVSLLPVEEVPSIVADTLYRIYGEHLNENGIGFAFEVTDMKLGMSLVSSDGKDNEARLIPSWYIYYNKRWCDAEEYMVPNKLILSAIDGNYIEPRITTDDIR